MTGRQGCNTPLRLNQRKLWRSFSFWQGNTPQACWRQVCEPVGSHHSAINAQLSCALQNRRFDSRTTATAAISSEAGIPGSASQCMRFRARAETVIKSNKSPTPPGMTTVRHPVIPSEAKDLYMSISTCAALCESPLNRHPTRSMVTSPQSSKASYSMYVLAGTRM